MSESSWENIQSEVLNWHIRTFPNATGEGLLKKLHEESLEFCAAVDEDFLSINFWDELADVCIVAMAYMSRTSGGKFCLADAIRNKLQINRDRFWGPEDINGNRVKL